MIHRLDGIRVLDHDIRFREPGPRIAEFVQKVADHVAFRVDLLGTGRQRLFRRENRRQQLIAHLHQVTGRFGRLGGLGGDRDDRLAREADLLDRKHGGVLCQRPGHAPLRRDVGPGQNRHHPRRRLGFAGVDGEDPRVGMLAANEAAVQHPLHLDVGCVTGPAAHLVENVVARQAQAYRAGFALHGAFRTGALGVIHLAQDAMIFTLPVRLPRQVFQRDFFARWLCPVARHRLLAPKCRPADRRPHDRIHDRTKPGI